MAPFFPPHLFRKALSGKHFFFLSLDQSGCSSGCKWKKNKRGGQSCVEKWVVLVSKHLIEGNCQYSNDAATKDTHLASEDILNTGSGIYYFLLWDYYITSIKIFLQFQA